MAWPLAAACLHLTKVLHWNACTLAAPFRLAEVSMEFKQTDILTLPGTRLRQTVEGPTTSIATDDHQGVL